MIRAHFLTLVDSADLCKGLIATCRLHRSVWDSHGCLDIVATSDENILDPCRVIWFLLRVLQILCRRRLQEWLKKLGVAITHVLAATWELDLAEGVTVDNV